MKATLNYSFGTNHTKYQIVCLLIHDNMREVTFLKNIVDNGRHLPTSVWVSCRFRTENVISEPKMSFDGLDTFKVRFVRHLHDSVSGLKKLLDFLDLFTKSSCFSLVKSPLPSIICR